MKKPSILFLLLFVTLAAWSQRIVPLTFQQDAQLLAFPGSDSTLCTMHPIVLGGEPTAEGGSGDYYYIWSPPTYLDDPTSPNPICTPEQSTTYMLTVTDSKGCTIREFVRITVDPCAGIELSRLNNQLKVFPNPGNETVYITGLDGLIMKQGRVEVLNMLGSPLITGNIEELLQGSQIDLQVNQLQNGFYFIRLYIEGQVIVKPLQISR